MNRSRALSLACSLVLTAPFSRAQNPGMPGQPGFPPRGEMRGEMHGGPEGGPGPGMGMMPHGMWWKKPEIVKDLNITADQQKQLDKILLDSRLQLIQMHATLEEEQVKLEPIMNANPFDQSRALAQISHIADLRADLEKTDARMLLSLRGVLTADQWTKLQTERQTRHEVPGPERQRHDWHHGPQGRSDSPNGPPPPPAGVNQE
jgi:Spy/CpxP family protein refolding chaperone